jgi:hypothetical protein
VVKVALISRGMYKLILRTTVDQEISQDGWRFTLSETLPTPWQGKRIGTPSFDGEILCISAMNPVDMITISEELISFGFRWSENQSDSDFSWFAFEFPKLDWLEAVKAYPMREELSEVELWQLCGSQLRYFVDHDGSVWWRGKDYDW